MVSDGAAKSVDRPPRPAVSYGLTGKSRMPIGILLRLLMVAVIAVGLIGVVAYEGELSRWHEPASHSS